ncbi:hypothetical protein GM160_00195 [Guyparkeria halophila]|uniref:HNH endonuclease n=2 Tax=Guyparkeria halophila TaxID=47960 RepID=A0A6I6D110_9GAMM|nr:hypothetical protein GM160_00195 [Guyparkeria halophila]
MIEPDSGWTLLSIDDLGSRTGTCERRGCGTDIQYEHLTYHPKRGYMVVGSTCIQHLTKKDRMLSANLIKIYRNVSAFAHQSTWEKGITKKRKPYIYATYNHHKIRIYGQEPYHAFQLHLKNKGERRYTFGEIYQIKNRSTLEAKELAYIALKGVLSTDTEEQDQLRNLYRELITSP